MLPHPADREHSGCHRDARIPSVSPRASQGEDAHEHRTAWLGRSEQTRRQIARARGLRSFQRAARSCRGYRAHLERHGVDHRTVRSIEEVPYTDKRSVFSDGDLDAWLDNGRVADAAELVASSGSSGFFSLGLSSRAEQRRLRRAIDDALRALGAAENSPTLLLNCLPMGIATPTDIATVATPSVHVEMATEILVRAGPSFDRVVIASEPLFLKELGEHALRLHGADFARPVVACFVGGEWVAESWRRYVSGLFGFSTDADVRPGVLVSMGAAEAGVRMLTETPLLRAIRNACDSQVGRMELVGEDRGYTPALLGWDPRRVHLEERHHADGSATLVATALEQRLMPLVRYDLEDEGLLLAPEQVNEVLARVGSPLHTETPLAAVWGRRSARLEVGRLTLRPEAVKESLFTTPAHAGTLTGRFRLTEGGEVPALHVQLRDGARPAPRLEGALADLTTALTGVPVAVVVHRYREYPYHEAGDFQHKPVYL